LKHIAVRSEVLNATVGGYKISISGLGRSTTHVNASRLAQPYLPYVDVEITDDADEVSRKFGAARRSVQPLCADIQNPHVKS
jgi:hypothetical protein